MCFNIQDYTGDIIQAIAIIASATIAAYIAIRGYNEARKTEVEKLVEENLRKHKI